MNKVQLGHLFSKKNFFQKASVILLVLIAVTVLIWSVKTGKIKIRAEVAGGTISGNLYDMEGNFLDGIKVTVQAPYTVSGNEINQTFNRTYLLTGLKENVVVSFSKDGTPYEIAFTDVPQNYWARKYIGALVYADIAKGYTPTIFDPERVVTRDQMAVFIARAVAGGDAKVPAPSGRPTFSDVGIDHWAYKYIEFLNKLGVAGGYPDGQYHPEYKVTRDQMAVFMARAIGLEPFDNPTPTFSDVSAAHWAYKEIESCFLNGVVSGFTPTEFRPTAEVTRAQMAVFLMKAFTNYPLTQDGYWATRGGYSVKPGVTETYDIFLEKQSVCQQGVSLNGRVFSSSGKGPLRGVFVSLDRDALPAPYNEHERYYAADTDSAGYFEIGCLPEGQHITLNLVAQNLIEGQLDITLASQTGANTSAGVIFMDDSQASARLTVSAKNSSDQAITGEAVLVRYGKRYSKKLAESGRAEFEVPPGSYDLIVQSAEVDKIIFYQVPFENQQVNLKPGVSQSLDLGNLEVDREESY